MTKERIKLNRLLRGQITTVPTLVLDGAVVVASTGFLADMVGDRERPRIGDIVPEYAGAAFQALEVSNRSYLVCTCPTNPDVTGRELTAVSFFPLEIKPGMAGVFGDVAVLLAFVDNYDEVMETVEEIRRPVMVALIDRKLNILAKQTGAVIRKFEKDKFLLLMTEDKLRLLAERKFEILRQARELDMGNKMPVTLSIGVGLNGATPAQSMEYARAALDLALGRGGDQALIKDGDKYEFFGGDTPESPSNERVRARVKLYALNELLDGAGSVIVMGHRHMDADCLGAAVGVLKIAAQKNRECFILAGETEAGLAAIYGQLRNEYADGVLINETEALAHANEGTLTVIVDANRPGMVESPALLEKSGKLVVIDHHRLAADFIDGAVLTYQEPFASSACEMVCEMLQYQKDTRFKPVEADLMLMGITVDTKGFTQKTGAKTFEAAAYLRRMGADSARVKSYLQEGADDVKAVARTVASAELLQGRAAVSVCGESPNPGRTAARAADELLGIAGVQASFVISAVGGTTHICARSLGKINVQVIMERFGGGGHQTVAAAQLEGADTDGAKGALMDELDRYIREREKGDVV